MRSLCGSALCGCAVVSKQNRPAHSSLPLLSLSVVSFCRLFICLLVSFSLPSFQLPFFIMSRDQRRRQSVSGCGHWLLCELHQRGGPRPHQTQAEVNEREFGTGELFSCGSELFLWVEKTLFCVCVCLPTYGGLR